MQTLRVSLLVLRFIMGIVAVMLAASAYAEPRDNSIHITILTDEFITTGPGAGCSLREGIQAINNRAPFGGCPGGGAYDTVLLLPGQVYTLSRTGAGEDDNATGDLDIKWDTVIKTDGTSPSNRAIINGQAGWNDRTIEVISKLLTLDSVTLQDAPAGVKVRSNAGLAGHHLRIENLTRGLDLAANSTTNLTHFEGEGVAMALECLGEINMKRADLERSRIWIWNSCKADLSDVTMVGPQATNSAITNYGSLKFKRGRIRDFVGLNGGGIDNFGTLHVANSVFSHNTASGFSGSKGGALHFNNGSSGSIYFSDLTHNTANTGGGLVNSGDTVTINSSLFYDNTGLSTAGAIYNTGNATLNLTNVTMSNNQTNGEGGGIVNGGAVNLNNVTITENTADVENNGSGNGGGVMHAGTAFKIKNSIIARNHDLSLTMFNSSPDCMCGGNPLTSQGNNLIGANDVCTEFANGVNGDKAGTKDAPLNPMLNGLADDGGPTDSHEPQNGSPAVNAGNNGTCEATDQRGAPRPSGPSCDMGSVERGATVPTATLTPTKTHTPTRTNTPNATPTLTHTQTKTPTPEWTWTPAQCEAKPGDFSILKPEEDATLEKMRVKINWSDSECVNKYKLRIRKHTKRGEQVVNEKLTESKYKTEKLERGTTYWLDISAKNKEGKTRTGWQSFTIAPE